MLKRLAIPAEPGVYALGSKAARVVLEDHVDGRSLTPDARHAAWCDAAELHRRLIAFADDPEWAPLVLAESLVRRLGPGGGR